MWLRSLLFTLAMVLILSFSLGCTPEAEDPYNAEIEPQEDQDPQRDEQGPDYYGPEEE